jgi:signal transduction histidine kinase/CheY-like chemotaxis protein
MGRTVEETPGGPQPPKPPEAARARKPSVARRWGGRLLAPVAALLRRGRAPGLRERDRFRDIGAHAPCLLWSADIEDQGGELLYWQMKLANPEAAQRFFPLKLHPSQSYQEAWYYSRLAEDRHRTEAPGCAEIRAGRSYVQEFRCRGADGEIRWFSEAIQVETVAPGRWRAVGVCTDITERQRREDELRERVEQLARADRAKDRFLAVLAHELRNPIGTISNTLQLLKLRAGADPRLERPLEIIGRQVDYQAHLLDDLLNVSRIVRGKIRLQRVRLDLARLVREVAEDQRAALERAGLMLHYELPPEPVWVMGDPTRLAQVLGNLLQNALKFTDPGGEVGVRCSVLGVGCSASDGSDGSDGSDRIPNTEHRTPTTEHPIPNTAVVVVHDTGIGIEAELLPHLFESFIQAERSLERSRGGLGLGLALVKGLVELHGGSVAGHSDGPGCGAAFTLHLPLTEAAPPREGESPAAPLPSGAWRLLLVEDDPDAATSLQELLEALGCQVTVAYTGTAGIELAQQIQPEVVLCDLGLPGIDGCEVAVRLRQLPATAAACLIAISGYGQEEDRRRSQEAGFDRHLTKPIDIDELRRILELAPHGRSEARSLSGEEEAASS